MAHIKKATNNFHQNRLIARGYYGTSVYKGYFQHNDSSCNIVAVKRIHASEKHQFKTEIELLCQFHHPNIISLIGFCDNKDDKIIVYEYMSNGSLYERLQDGELSWKKRLEICIGAARGLHYLHAGAKRTIIHRRIEPSNIVLDNSMQPKLTDFGISVLGAHFMSKPKPIKVDSIGTLRYMAPEYYRDSTVTDKCDVYSFGLVLLQVVWGRKILDILSGRNYQKKRVEDNIDPNIKGKIAPECWQVYMGITERCVKFEPEERPAMDEVEVELEHALLLQEQVDISNTDGDYILLSKTIINQGSCYCNSYRNQ